MNKWTCILLATLLSGCFTRSSYITQDMYNSTQIGQPISTVTSRAGEPYSIHKNSAGEQEYEYVESISNGTDLVYENHYIFIVKDGKIVGKRESQEQTPPYEMIYQDDPNHENFPKK